MAGPTLVVVSTLVSVSGLRALTISSSHLGGHGVFDLVRERIEVHVREERIAQVDEALGRDDVTLRLLDLRELTESGAHEGAARGILQDGPRSC
jgi:hypothetical protein